MDDGIVQKNSEKTMAENGQIINNEPPKATPAQMSWTFLWQSFLILLSFSFSFTFLILPLLRSLVSDEVILTGAGLIDPPNPLGPKAEQLANEIIEAMTQGWDGPVVPIFNNITNKTNISQTIKAALTPIPPVVNAGATLWGQLLFALAVLVGMTYGRYEQLISLLERLQDNNTKQAALSEFYDSFPGAVLASVSNCDNPQSNTVSTIANEEKFNQAIAFVSELKENKRHEIVAYLKHGLFFTANVLAVGTGVTLYSCNSYLPWLTNSYAVITLAKNYIKTYALSMPFYMVRTLLEQFIFFCS